MALGNGQISLDLLILISSVLFFFLNGFILFRQWPSKRDGHEIGPYKLITLLDPLIISIVCPMTSDLFFIPEWGSGCSATYTAVIAAVIVILCVSSLFVCYWLTELALPSSTSVFTPRSTYLYKPRRLLCWTLPSVEPLKFAFFSSTAGNIVLTCLLLPVLSNIFDVSQNFDSEICQPFFLFEMMLNVFVTCASIQVSYTGLYFCICRANQSEQGHDNNLKTDDRFKNRMRIIILYTLTALLCLLSACFLRFIFITCSCQGLYELRKSLPTVTFLMTLKLPCAYIISYFWSKRNQVDNKK